MSDSPENPIAIASHQRSGTHLLIDLIRRQFPSTQSWKWPLEKLNALYLNLERLTPEHRWHIDVSAAERLKRRARRCLLKTHATSQMDLWSGHENDYVQKLAQGSTWLYVYRDPRAVMCSYHLLMQIGDPSTRVPLSDFIRQEHEATGVSRIRFWSDHVCGWLNKPNVMAFDYDEVIKNTRVVLEKLSVHLHEDCKWTEPLLPPKIMGTWHSRLYRAISTSPPNTAIGARYKGKQPHEWCKVLNEDDIAFIRHEAREFINLYGANI